MNCHHASGTLGERLRQTRKYVGFSEEEVSRYLGLPKVALRRIENGTQCIGDPELRRLAKLYQTNVSALTCHEPEEVRWESFLALDQASADLSEADRDEILRFIRFLQSRRPDDRE